MTIFVASTALGAPAGAASVAALFSDQTTDEVLFVGDLNGDGDANDPGELTVFFDGGNASGLVAPTGNIYSMAQGRSGNVFVGDGDTDAVYRLRDLNGDGDAQGAGEASVWFSAGNAEGMPLQTPNGVVEGPDGAIYIVQADTVGTPTRDVVYRTEDLNGDGDANDAGEVSVWLDLGALSEGSSAFDIAFDGSVAYIADTAGGSPRVYRAEDIDGNGSIDAGEVNEFVRSVDDIFSMSVAASDGDVFSYDFQGDLLARYADLDGNGEIDVAVERFDIWDAAPFADGAVFDFDIDGGNALIIVNSFDGDDSLLRLTDLNGDGDFLDAGETTALLLFSEQGAYPRRPRSVIFYDGAALAPVPLPASALLLSAALSGLLLPRAAKGRR